MISESVYMHMIAYEQNKRIEELKENNINLSKVIQENKEFYDNLIEHYKKAAKEKRVVYKYIDRPKTETLKEKLKKSRSNQNRKTPAISHHNKKPVRRYPEYSNSIKLVSDSTIKKLPNNLLESTQPIHGQYNDIIIAGPKCGNYFKDTYKLESECYVTTLSDDKLYLSQSNADMFRSYNSADKGKYRINCHYQKEYGLMHNCVVERYSYF